MRRLATPSFKFKVYTMKKLTIKRAYEPADKTDGMRILVDRLWPRGVSKKDAHIDLWLKEVAPSVPLRKWFGHDPEKWDEFQRKYMQELKHNPALDELRDIIEKHGNTTLIYAAHDTEHNHAVVLLHYLKE